MYFLLLYDVVDDYIERRAEFRDEHLALAKQAAERGLLRLGGAYSDPPDGAALVFHADHRSHVQEFARNDPYVTNGLVKDWTVRQWTVVTGGDLPA